MVYVRQGGLSIISDRWTTGFCLNPKLRKDSPTDNTIHSIFHFQTTKHIRENSFKCNSFQLSTLGRQTEYI